MNKMDVDTELTACDPEIEEVARIKETLEKGGLRTLRFPPNLEAAFNDYHHSNTLKHVRVSMLTGLCLYALFGLVDLQLNPTDRMHMWLIRYGVVCPVIAAGLAFTYAASMRRFLQPVIAFVMLVGSLGIVSMVYFDPTPTKNYYYSGILLLIMGAFTFVSLRFRYAMSWALATTIAYEVVAIFVNHTDSGLLVQNSFNILAMITIGSFSNCLMENYLRRDFLNSLLLKQENRQLQQAGEELRRLSISDALTGLDNRRHFENRLKQEWMRAMRSETPISVILLDVDAFKQFNDNYGHQAGDECLGRVAEVVGGFARRPGDVAARYGGEELVLLLPGIELDDAVGIAEECRSAVETLKITHDHSAVANVVTVSAGVSTMVPEMDISSKVLIAAADRSLYQAKRDGRNRVVPVSPADAKRPQHLYQVS